VILVAVLIAVLAAIRSQESPCTQSMVSSLHPLGERARGNRWAVTISWFVFGSVAAGGLVGAVTAGAGGLVMSALGVPGWGGWLPVVLMAVAVGGVLDLVGVRPPGPHRQVNENWIGTYRGSVYGVAFGAQIGSGLMTYIVTWGVYAMLLASFATGSAAAGALVGAVFGMGRSAAPLVAGWIDRPSRLTLVMEKMANSMGAVTAATSAGLALVGVAGLVAKVLS
jgi:hypothetical protein